MPTVISPEITDKSPWWIPRQRYYELKHFCLQYPDWKMMLKLLDGYQYPTELSDIPKTETNRVYDPVGEQAMARTSLTRRVEMVEKAAQEAGADLQDYILKSITEGIPYAILRVKFMIPCCKNEYYDRYRKFFWVLDKLRD